MAISAGSTVPSSRGQRSGLPLLQPDGLQLASAGASRQT